MANNLKRLLHLNGFTAKQLEHESGISSTTIDKIANNRMINGKDYVPTLVMMVNITDAFNRMLKKKSEERGHSDYTSPVINDIFPDYKDN